MSTTYYFSGAGMYMEMIHLDSTNNITLRDRIILDFREGMIGADDFTPMHAIIITWRNMTFANRQDFLPLLVRKRSMTYIR